MDFLDLPRSGRGTLPGTAWPLKPVKHLLVYLVAFYLTDMSLEGIGAGSVAGWREQSGTELDGKGRAGGRDFQLPLSCLPGLGWQRLQPPGGSKGQDLGKVLVAYTVPHAASRRFPSGSVVNDPAATAGDLGSISGSGRHPGKGNGNPHQYPCLEKLMDRGVWWVQCRGRTELTPPDA